MTRLITADASKVSGADFFRAVTGRPQRSQVERDEADARVARIRLFETIQRVEYAKARREREAIIRDHSINGSRPGETYEDYHTRLNEPFVKAAERVNARIAELELRRAA
jgi:hypothetical protein